MRQALRRADQPGTRRLDRISGARISPAVAGAGTCARLGSADPCHAGRDGSRRRGQIVADPAAIRGVDSRAHASHHPHARRGLDAHALFPARRLRRARCAVLHVTPLLRELIVEAVRIGNLRRARRCTARCGTGRGPASGASSVPTFLTMPRIPAPAGSPNRRWAD